MLRICTYKFKQFEQIRLKNGVDDGNRTHDRRSHNPELYQLSYVHQRKSASKLTRSVSTRGRRFGAPGGTRTPDPRLRRPLLYPPELPGQIKS
jgi:hypothetical protein